MTTQSSPPDAGDNKKSAKDIKRLLESIGAPPSVLLDATKAAKREEMAAKRREEEASAMPPQEPVGPPEQKPEPVKGSGSLLKRGGAAAAVIAILLVIGFGVWRFLPSSGGEGIPTVPPATQGTDAVPKPEGTTPLPATSTLVPSPTNGPPSPTPKPELQASMSVDKTEVHPGEELTFTFTITNAGPGKVQGAVLICNLVKWGEPVSGDFNKNMNVALDPIYPTQAPVTKSLTFTVNSDASKESITPPDCGINYNDGRTIPVPTEGTPVVALIRSSVQLKLLADDKEIPDGEIELGAGQSKEIEVLVVNSDGTPYTDSMAITWTLEPPGDLLTLAPENSCELVDSKCNVDITAADDNVGRGHVTFGAQDIPNIEEAQLDIVIYPAVYEYVKLRNLPSTAAIEAGTTTSVEKPLLIIGRTEKDPISQKPWWYVRYKDEQHHYYKAWIRKDAVIQKKPSNIATALETLDIKAIPWPVPDKAPYSAKEFTLYADTDATNAIVQLPADGEVEVLQSNLGPDGLVRVNATFWIPAAIIDEDGTLKKEEAKIAEVCWPPNDVNESAPGTCRETSELNSSLIDPSMISDSPTNSAWKQVTIEGWMQKSQIKTGE